MQTMLQKEDQIVNQLHEETGLEIPEDFAYVPSSSHTEKEAISTNRFLKSPSKFRYSTSQNTS